MSSKPRKRQGRRAVWLAAGLAAALTAAGAEGSSGWDSPEGKALQAAAQVKPIDLNAATEAQLAAVRGLTPELAKRIAAARPFKSLDELARIGMSKVQIDAVRPFLTVAARTGRKGHWRKPEYRLAPGEKVNVNAAEHKVLTALPGIGQGLAHRIIEGRPYAKVDDLLRVKGIGSRTLARIRSLVVVR